MRMTCVPDFRGGGSVVLELAMLTTCGGMTHEAHSGHFTALVIACLIVPSMCRQEGQEKFRT